MMLPVPSAFSGGRERVSKEVRATVASALKLTEDDVNEMLASGQQTRLANRVAWGMIYLKRAGLLETPRRGVYRITERGQSLLAEAPSRVDINLLLRYPEFVEFRNLETNNGGGQAESTEESGVSKLTPDEQIRAGV
jgi:restriction system protein